MVVDIKARILQAKVSGELKCQLTIFNHSHDKSEHVMTLSGQLFNWHSSSNGLVPGDFPGALKTKTHGSRKSKSHETLCGMTNPTLIIADKELIPMSKGIVIMEDNFPEDWLPSFVGRFLSFKTKLCLELVIKESQEQPMRFWFSIQVDPPASLLATYDIADSDSSKVLRRTNPFMSPANASNEHTIGHLHPRVNGIGQISSATAFFARMSDANGEIAKMNLQRRHVQPGNVIVGLIDFRDTPQFARICCQFSVSLVAVESYPHHSKSIPEERTTQATTQEVCYGTDAISFNIEVPHQATPTFATPFFAYNWILKFEFVLTNSMKVQALNQEFWRAPSKLKVKSTKWETALFIYKQ